MRTVSSRTMVDRVSAAILVLPPDLASQIAAGEVVERPASVVKELIENALDANATRIDVSISAGGVGLIQVADDGQGMSEQSAPLCLGRHATSKLRAFSDLERLTSYGFRGEALPSIASVSRLTVKTRTAETEGGVCLRASGTTVPTTEPVGHPVGTTVIVEDLFFNVPARRKFLRSTNTEAGHVAEVVLDAALSNPQVSFTLQRDGRTHRSYLRVVDRRQRAEQVFSDVALWSVQGERGPLVLEAYLSGPERARQGAAGLKLLVNGRPVKDRALCATIAHAYGSGLEKGRYPRGVVYLTLPSRLVDVNVHPQKAEVRFSDTRAVGDAVFRLISRELSKQSLDAGRASEVESSAAPPPSRSPRVMVEEEPFTRSSRVPTAFSDTRIEVPQLLRDRAALRANQERSVPIRTPEIPLGRSEHQVTGWKNLRFIAQVRHTYLVCEGPDGIYILDQHAAAERVLFTRLKKSYSSNKVTAQALLFPIVVELSEEESALLDSQAESVSALGLDVRKRAHDAATIHAIPKLLSRGSPERILRDLLREFSRHSEKGFSQSIDKALSTMACHEAIRAGDHLSSKEAEALLSSLDQADFEADCPHGRPVVAITSFRDLERKVGRR